MGNALMDRIEEESVMKLALWSTDRFSKIYDLVGKLTDHIVELRQRVAALEKSTKESS